MTILVRMSENLFIIASAAIRFILDRKHVDHAQQIDTLLRDISLDDFSGSRHTTIMDHVYMRIIRAAQPDPTDSWTDRFQTFVGTIVLYNPLPCGELTLFLDVDVNDIIRALTNLHSLFAPCKTQTYRAHHKSFYDFICHRGRCKMGLECHINPPLHHMRVAERCLRIMNDNLKFNIYNLNPREQHIDVSKLHNRVWTSIPAPLRVCSYLLGIPSSCRPW